MKMSARSLFGALAVIATAGCSGDDGASRMTDPGLTAFSIAPIEDAAGVRLDASISLTFSNSMDRLVTEQNFHLISEWDMTDFSCPEHAMTGHGDMDWAMGDASMMDHLCEAHNTNGQLYWNEDNTQCTFQPESMMQPNTRYMVHIGPEMVRMIENRMGPLGMMGYQESTMLPDHMMSHFTTMAGGGDGSGHEDHH